MNMFEKIIALFFLAEIVLPLEAIAGEDYSDYTKHNGNTDANLTTFILDGSHYSAGTYIIILMSNSSIISNTKITLLK